MAATNIFYRLPSQRGTRIASIAGTECTLHQFCNYIIDIEGLNKHDFIIASGTKVFRPSSCSLQNISLQNNSHVDILIPLLGGKGGFGSLLRAIGAQIEKTTNRDACRDLSGRRLRDIKREDELRKLVELKEKLEEERKERKKQKIEKLKKQSEKSKASASIQELVSMFDDHAFNKRRLELSDILDAAVEKGLINSKKRQLNENGDSSNKKSRLESMNDKNLGDGHELRHPKPVHSKNGLAAGGNISKNEPQKHDKNHRKNDLWLGLEDEDDELSDAASETNSHRKLTVV